MKLGMELAVHGWSSSHPSWFLPAKRGNSLLGLPKQWVARCCKGSACTPKYLPHFLPNTFYFFSFLQGNFRTPQWEDRKTSPSTEQRATTTRPFSPIIMEVEKYLKHEETTIGDTPIFHWTMIVGGRVYSIPNKKDQKNMGANFPPPYSQGLTSKEAFGPSLWEEE